MNKRARPVTVRFLLVQPDGEALTWTDPEVIEALAKFLKIWAGTVDGEAERLFIIIGKSEPAP